MGSNFEISIDDVVKIISEIMGKDINVQKDKDRQRPKNSEVDRLWSDNSKARRLLQWEPAYAGAEGFRKGIAETVNWFIQPENLARYNSGVYNL